MLDERDSQGAAFEMHPLRGRVLAEVHARPLFAAMQGPRRILHFAFMADHVTAAKARAALAAFCRERACPEPAADAKYHRIELSPALLRWEHHGEFLTYTWKFPQEIPRKGNDKVENTAFWPNVDELAAVMRLLPQPGPLIVAVDLHILPEAQVGQSWRHVFKRNQVAASEVSGGGALVATNFNPDAFGFVRMLVVDRSLAEAEVGALAQRVLEIETYRTLALLGLPQAQDLSPSIRRIEVELPALMQQIREGEGYDASRSLLDKLTALAAELEAGAAQSLFRFGATKAYYQLLNQRLAELREQPLSDLPTISAFLTRRLTPAISTCAATEARQDNLSRKLARAAQLLRTRVEIELESQNKDLLSKLNERSQLQLQLQTAVKGISIAAMTYYTSALLHIIFEGLHQKLNIIDPMLSTAVSVPFILAFVLWMVRQRRKSGPKGVPLPLE